MDHEDQRNGGVLDVRVETSNVMCTSREFRDGCERVSYEFYSGAGNSLHLR